MSECTFNRGDTVYSVEGQQAEYLMEHDGGHLVVPQYREDIDEEWDSTYTGEPRVWPEVFAKPPVPVVHESVAAARSELDALEAKVREAEYQLRTMRDERAQLQRDQSAVRTRLHEHEALRNIDAYLSGSITHFVTDIDYAPSIKTAEQTLELRDGYRKSIRLLGLFGDESRNVRWKVCVYGDGSGSMTEVIPCLSLEDAQDHARQLLTTVTFPALRNDKLGTYYGRRAVELAAELGVDVPEDVAAKVAADAKETAAKNLKHARSEAARYAAELEKAEAHARSFGVETVGSAS